MVIVKRHADTMSAYASPELSMKAKGILAYLAAAEGDHMTIERMCEEMAEGYAAIRRAVKELEESGHLKRERKNEGKRVWYDWTVTF